MTEAVAPAGGRDASRLPRGEHDGSEGDRSHLRHTSVGACAWCRGAIPADARRDSRFCSKRCRQASHRFGAGAVARGRTTDPIRIAYADPPYPGLAAKYYRHHPDYGGEVDHGELLDRLRPFDGWALSTSAEALPDVLAIAVGRGLRVRVAAWFRGARPNKRATRARSAWEPVIYVPGRRVEPAGATRRAAPAGHDASLEYSRDASPIDALVHVARARFTDPDRVIGAKPATFAYWLFDLLGALPGDDFFDLFGGSGGVARAWNRYVEASRLEPRRVGDHPAQISADLEEEAPDSGRIRRRSDERQTPAGGAV